MNDRFRVSGLLAQRLVEQGFSIPALLRHAGLPTGFFNQEKIWVTTEELFALWRAIAAVSGDVAIGLKLGSEARVERFDAASIAALSSHSFGDALQRMARYKKLTCPEEIRVRSKERECSVEFHWLLAGKAEPPVLIDLCFSWILAIGRRGTGGTVIPLRVELKRPANHVEILESYYRCRVRFNAGKNALVLRAGDLERPFITHNAELLAMLAPQLEADLDAHEARLTVSDQVTAVLKRLLAGRRPSIRDVARELRVSSRTLQRRLTESGVTFQQLLEEARRELARHYLGQSSFELNETAYLLGYENTNSFFRAFQHWEGTSPGQWRSNHRTANV